MEITKTCGSSSTDDETLTVPAILPCPVLVTSTIRFEYRKQGGFLGQSPKVPKPSSSSSSLAY
jgi:hypothetical protein